MIEKDGSFQRQAAVDFNEFNPNVEQYQFIRQAAISPKSPKLKSKIVINEDLADPGNLTLAKDINAKGISKSNSSLDSGILKRKWVEKGKALMLADEETNQKDSHSMHSNDEDNS